LETPGLIQNCQKLPIKLFQAYIADPELFAIGIWCILYGQAYSSRRNSQKPANQHHNQLMICKEVKNIRSILHVLKTWLHYSTVNWDSRDNEIKLHCSEKGKVKNKHVA